MPKFLGNSLDFGSSKRLYNFLFSILQADYLSKFEWIDQSDKCFTSFTYSLAISWLQSDHCNRIPMFLFYLLHFPTPFQFIFYFSSPNFDAPRAPATTSLTAYYKFPFVLLSLKSFDQFVLDLSSQGK